MEIVKSDFLISAASRAQYPAGDRPEVAFIGRSNVGKSSIINSLTNRKALARVSNTPGRTRLVNFFLINDSIHLVDLPGYGYANANEKLKAQWGVMIEKYPHTSKQLKLVFLLIDIRHAPGKNDIQMYEWVKQMGFEPIIIATKADKIKRSQLDKCLKVIRETLQLGKETTMIPFSSVSKQGREEIYEVIERYL